MKKYICTVCQWVYDPEVGDSESSSLTRNNIRKRDKIASGLLECKSEAILFLAPRIVSMRFFKGQSNPIC